MKKYTYIHTLFLIFVFCTYCQGQNKTNSSATSPIKQATISQPATGLVRTIKQDKEGNIWLASTKGVFKYDGESFTNVTSKVRSARFFSVLEDRKGNFWFSTTGSGVYYYDGKSFKNYAAKQGLAGGEVTDIYEDKIGNIWFGTKEGASRYDGKSFQNFKMKEGLAQSAHPDDSVHVSTFDQDFWRHNDVNAIIQDKTGRFWFGTRGDVSIYDGKAFTSLTNTDGKSFTNVRSIIEDKKGNIWLGGNDGLWRYDGHTFTNFTHNVIGYIYEDKKGNLWTSSENVKDRQWLLSRYDEKSLTGKMPVVAEIKSKYKGNKGMLLGISEASDGSIWVGASDGVYRYDGNTVTELKGNVVGK